MNFYGPRCHGQQCHGQQSFSSCHVIMCHVMSSFVIASHGWSRQVIKSLTMSCLTKFELIQFGRSTQYKCMDMIWAFRSRINCMCWQTETNTREGSGLIISFDSEVFQVVSNLLINEGPKVQFTAISNFSFKNF